MQTGFVHPFFPLGAILAIVSFVSNYMFDNKKNENKNPKEKACNNLTLE